MQNSVNPQDNEIDLSEIFSVFWAHKIIVSMITGLSIFLGGYYTLAAKKEYTASAIFQIEQVNRSGFDISSEIGALASIAGLAGGGSITETALLIERMTGREFILLVSDKASLDSDLFFNNYNPDNVDPLWKATVKKLIGWQKTEAEKNAIIENNIIKSYNKRVEISDTFGGSISISVTHSDPKKAARYANIFMEELRLLVEYENDAAQDLRLTYLSETLADALQEMETAQQNLKNYALENSALAQENFISGSLKLDGIRMEKRKVEEFAELLSVLERLVKSGNLDSDSYTAIRSSHPLVDDVSFRRILGMSETISAWSWPEVETVEAVRATLRDRIKRLDVNIKTIEENAKIYATSAEDLAKFTRDAKIAEATYTVLIEQVKSHSLAAGFQPEIFKVFEYATPPLAPSSPRRNFIIMLTAFLGLLIGCAIALFNAKRRGVYYTRKRLLSDANAKLNIKSRSIRTLSRKSISKIRSSVSKRRLTEVDEAEIKLADTKLIYLANYGGRPTAAGTARVLAVQSSESGRKVILCDTAGLSSEEIGDKTNQSESESKIIHLKENMNLVNGPMGASFFTASNFNSIIKDLIADFDQVFICSSKADANLGLIALEKFSPSIVLLAGLRNTKKLDIKKITATQPIDILFYD